MPLAHGEYDGTLHAPDAHGDSAYEDEPAPTEAANVENFFV